MTIFSDRRLEGKTRLVQGAVLPPVFVRRGPDGTVDSIFANQLAISKLGKKLPAITVPSRSVLGDHEIQARLPVINLGNWPRGVIV